jgi:deoxyribose-phosphate aldolase
MSSLNPYLRSIIQQLSVEELASKIDHAVLKPWAKPGEVEKALEELESLGLRCLITTPLMVREFSSLTRACVGAVVGFPFGYATIESKIKELEDVIGYGAREADIVINYHAYLAGRKELVDNEVKALVAICREVGITCKLIIEAPALEEDEVVELVKLVAKWEPHYIKTSSGYGPRPTQPEDVVTISEALREANKQGRVGIKAAGGIRTAVQALMMIISGASIIGTSTPSTIVNGFKKLKKLTS